MSTERAFFPTMEEFGFFSHIYEKLPPDFTAIFEIARVLEDDLSPLSEKLREVIKLPSPADSTRRDKAEDFHRYTPSGERYAADLITSYHDVARVYPNQFLLPDEIFMQRLALRELWMPVAKSALILPVNNTEEGFSFDSQKQKVYLLFDTSRSMQAHHRIHLAKAILYHFLKRNRTELGHISLRTFDDKVGELHTAVDKESYDALMRFVLRINHLGEGTVLQKAILQALDDIREMDHLSGAEILIITDGAVQLDEALIRSRMDDHVQINAVKIGHVEVYASDAQIADMVTRGLIKDRKLLDLRRQRADIESELRVVEGATRRHVLEQMLSSVRAQLAEHKVPFGNELQHLSTVFVNLDDFDETARFRADAEAIADLEELARALEAEAAEFLTSELTKKLAVLHDHVDFLQRYETDPALKERLKAIDDHIRKLLSQFLGAPASAEAGGDGEAGGEASTSTPAQVAMSEEDARDLKFLLEIDGAMGRNWGLLVRWFIQRMKAMVRRVRDKFD